MGYYKDGLWFPGEPDVWDPDHPAFLPPDVNEWNDAYYGRADFDLLRLYRGVCSFAMTDAATIDPIFELAIRQRVNDIRPKLSRKQKIELENLDDTEVADLADLIRLGTAVCIQIATQYAVPRFHWNILRHVSTTALAWPVGNVASLEYALKDVYLPPICYTLSEYMNPIFQLCGGERYSRKFASYFLPFGRSLIYDDVMADIAALKGEYLAGNASELIKAPLMRFPIKRFKHRAIFPIDSDLGAVFAACYPIEDDAAITDIDFDTPINISINQKVGMGDKWQAAALLRTTASASDPGFIITATPGAGELSILAPATYAVTTPTNIADTLDDMDFLGTVATNQSRTQVGPFASGQPNVSTLGFGAADAAGWNDMLVRWMASKFGDRGPLKVIAANRVLPDLKDQAFGTRNDLVQVGNFYTDKSAPARGKGRNLKSPADYAAFAPQDPAATFWQHAVGFITHPQRVAFRRGYTSGAQAVKQIDLVTRKAMSLINGSSKSSSSKTSIRSTVKSVSSTLKKVFG